MLCAFEILVQHTLHFTGLRTCFSSLTLNFITFQILSGCWHSATPLPMKYILVTGGVISGIGKGIIASSIGTILKSCGLRVTAIKIDPYINIDAGTFSPYEHGMREDHFPPVKHWVKLRFFLVFGVISLGQSSRSRAAGSYILDLWMFSWLLIHFFWLLMTF